MTRFGLRRSEPIDVESLVYKGTPADVILELKVLYRLVESLPEKLRIPLLLRHVESASLDEMAFSDAIARAPAGPAREDAEARRVQALEATGQLARCASARSAYLARFPNGVHAASVRGRCPTR